MRPVNIVKYNNTGEDGLRFKNKINAEIGHVLGVLKIYRDLFIFKTQAKLYSVYINSRAEITAGALNIIIYRNLTIFNKKFLLII